MIFAHIIANGRVQGVFFRAAVKEIAKKMGVNGYARNLPERDKVEIVCECADEKQLDEFTRAINIREEDGIFVKEVKITSKKKIDIGNYTDFDIRYY